MGQFTEWGREAIEAITGSVIEDDIKRATMPCRWEFWQLEIRAEGCSWVPQHRYSWAGQPTSRREADDILAQLEGMGGSYLLTERCVTGGPECLEGRARSEVAGLNLYINGKENE